MREGCAMFFGGGARLYKKVLEAEDLDRLTVDKGEFIRRCVESGMDEAKARYQAEIAAVLGSAVAVGDKLLTVSG